MRFTPNDYVTVKLTEEGRRRYLAELDKINAALSRAKSPHRKSIAFDEDGIYSGSFGSFWAVMCDIGGYYAGPGADILFEWIEPKEKTA